MIYWYHNILMKNINKYINFYKFIADNLEKSNCIYFNDMDSSIEH